MDMPKAAGPVAPYLRLAVMLVASFAAMYLLMYAMADRLTDVRPSLNETYMAALMTAPMAVIELGLMGDMYPDRRVNLAILAAAVLVGLGAFAAIRAQALVDDSSFLHAMIPHHSAAILMCREAELRDPQVKTLCQGIIKGQQTEIDEMKAILARAR